MYTFDIEAVQMFMVPQNCAPYPRFFHTKSIQIYNSDCKSCHIGQD